MGLVNIELKAKCFHPEKVEVFLFSKGAGYKSTDHLKDTYFNLPKGILKLRQGNIEKNLVYFNRPDPSGTKQPDFILIKADDGNSIAAIPVSALDVKVVVKKNILY